MLNVQHRCLLIGDGLDSKSFGLYTMKRELLPVYDEMSLQNVLQHSSLTGLIRRVRSQLNLEPRLLFY